MADENQSATTTMIGASTAPGANLATAEQGKLDASGTAEQAKPFAMPEYQFGKVEGLVPDPPRELPAAERLRTFEDEHLGKDAVRIGGKIERGYGSPFAALDPEKKRQYAALEKLVEAEQKLADAHAALIQAEADHEAALAECEPKPDAAPVEQ